MNYSLFKINIDKTIERDFEIENIKNIEWEDNIKNVFISFNFTSTSKLECGDKVELYNTVDDVVVWYGVITTIEQTKKKEYKYKGYDVGFYLLKNELTTQYTFNQFQYILEDVCKKCELQIGVFPDFGYLGYTHIYRKVVAEKILKDAYNNLIKNGVKDLYFFDCKNWKVNIKQYKSSDELKGAISLLGRIDTFKFIKGFNISHSMEDMKNYVEIFSDDSVNKKNTDKPDASYGKKEFIEKYGLLRYTEDLDKNSEKTPKQVLETRLDELCKVGNKIQLTVWGDYKLQKGIITTINEEKIGLKETYKVLSSKHSINEISEEVIIEIEKQKNQSSDSE